MSKPRKPPTEIHDEPHILYKEEGRTFNYTATKEGFYSNKTLLRFRRPLPDDYEVITNWEDENQILSNVPYFTKF